MHRLKADGCTCSTTFLSIREVAAHSARPIVANLDCNCSISNANSLNILISQVPYGVPVDAERHFDFDTVFFTALILSQTFGSRATCSRQKYTIGIDRTWGYSIYGPESGALCREVAREEDRQVKVFTF